MMDCWYLSLSGGREGVGVCSPHKERPCAITIKTASVALCKGIKKELLYEICWLPLFLSSVLPTLRLIASQTPLPSAPIKS